MKRILAAFLLVSLSTGPALAKKSKKAAKATSVAAVTPANAKELGTLMGPYKFGMSKDEVVAVVSTELDARYKPRMDASSGVYESDQIRKEKSDELHRFKTTWTDFNGTKTGWDVSMISDQFGHNTGEAIMDLWENDGGKNQRRFFFFADGRLYKMFISLDTSKLPSENRNFKSFQSAMQNRFGTGKVSDRTIVWVTSDFQVNAVDRLREYTALGLVIMDASTEKRLASAREANKAPPAKNSVVDSVIDSGAPLDLDANKGAADKVINSK